MALFATSVEEKEKKANEKKSKKFNELVDKYHLTDLDEEDYELIQNVCNSLTGNSLMEIGLKLSLGTKTEDQVKINRLAAIQEQNWIIINQLGRLNKNINQLIEIEKRK